jgi:hypothetical protein
MSPNNNPRSQPTDSARVARNRIFLLVLVLLGLGAGVFAIGKFITGNGPIAAVPTAVPTLRPPTPVPSPTPIILTSGTVLGRIERSEELHTTKFHMTTLIRAQKQGSWFFDWGGQKVMVIIKGTVEAGVDLKELKNIQVSEDERTIIITMPRAKILSVVIDSQEPLTYDGQPPNQIATSLLQPILDAGRQQIAATACEDGIIERANADAKTAFENLMGKFDLADYKVSILASQERGCPIDNVLKANP